MKTSKTIFHRALSMLLTATMVVTLFTVAAPAETQAAGLSFKGSGKSTVKIADKQCYTSDGNDFKTHWIKFKAAQDGTITLKFDCASSFSYYSAGRVTFCNSKRSIIGQKDEFWTNNVSEKKYYTTTYGVKKNQTYYFKVQCNAGTKITATTKKLTKTKANSKSKAKNLKKKTNVTGVIPAGNNKVDWYKIKVTSKAKVRIICSAQTNGSNLKNGIRVTFCNTNGKRWSNAQTSLTRSYPSDELFAYMVNRYDQSLTYGVEPGTYYIKVERMSKASSGSYTIKWTTF